LQKAIKDADLHFFRDGEEPHGPLQPLPVPSAEDEAAERAYLKFLQERGKRDHMLPAKYIIQQKKTRNTTAGGKVGLGRCGHTSVVHIS
jgi:hypothetical protein